MLTPNQRREAGCSSVETRQPGFQRRCYPHRDDLCFTESHPGDSAVRRHRRLTEMWARLSHDAQARVLDRREQDLELLVEVEEATPVAAEDEQERVHSGE